MLANVVDFDNIVLNFPLKTDGPFMDLRELQIGVNDADRIGAERWQVAAARLASESAPGADDWPNVPIQTAALTKRCVCRRMLLPGVLWKIDEPNRKVAILSDAIR